MTPQPQQPSPTPPAAHLRKAIQTPRRFAAGLASDLPILPTFSSTENKIERLLHRQKRHADRRRYIQHVPGWRELPGFGVNAEDHHRIRILICREEELSGRVDPEITRGLPLSGLVSHRRQSRGGGIDLENRQIVR